MILTCSRSFFMLIQYVSDVHTEFHSDLGIRWANEIPVMGDVLVLPGDIVTYESAYSVLSILANRFPHVIFVCGNHEYYRSNRGNIHNILAKVHWKFPNFHHLNNSGVTINGQRFVGTTLWWSASPHDEPIIRNSLNDYKMIEGYGNWIGKAHAKAKQYLQDTVCATDVVVTHHAPSFICRPKYLDVSSLDFAYYNNLNNLIGEKQPKLWLFGHTHVLTKERAGDTWLLSYPHGYAHNGVANPNDYALIES